MCRLQQTIEPDAKLKKMIDLLKIVLTINIIIIISHTIISFQKSESGTSVFMEIISCLFLFMGINSVNYIGVGLFILFSLYNGVFLFMELGTFFQVLFLSGISSSNDRYWKLSIDTFAMCFYLFSNAVAFPIYKEMKAQYLESIGFGQREEQENNNIGSINDNDNHNEGFRAFSGRGVAVGGN